MLRLICCVLVLSGHALAGERVFDFGKYPAGQTPYGFKSVVGGGGKVGDWKIITEPSSSPETGANPSSKRAVLAQLSQDSTDERFPMLVYDEETFGDFTLTTKFKLVDGLIEQMAGIAFRWQDTNNYYYVRASGIGNTFRFIKLVNGQRLVTLGPSVELQRGVWHELTIECKGNRISCLLNGKELIPPLTDNSFTAGRIAFWTKSDSVSYFGETKINFTPHETLAQNLLREAVQRYPRVVALKMYALTGEAAVPKIIASTYPDELGMQGGHTEQSVIQRDAPFYGKQNRVVLVTLPLHDRNGEVAAAVRVVLDSFPGQTEQNALARALPIVKEMEKRIRTAKDLLQ